jgi:hypothetical protein
MNDLLARVKQLLVEANYVVVESPADDDALLYENTTVIGFALEFRSPEELVAEWESRLSSLISAHEIALRRSRDKSWNAYALLLCQGTVSTGQKIVLQTIEEDLSGTRKIVRGDLPDHLSLTQALLPLLALQGAPELPVVDMELEIRSRTTELPDEVLKAFFSSASEIITLQVIEEAQ